MNKLLNNIKAARGLIITEGLSVDLTNSLLGKVIFVRYLIDRKGRLPLDHLNNITDEFRKHQRGSGGKNQENHTNDEGTFVGKNVSKYIKCNFNAFPTYFFYVKCSWFFIFTFGHC